MIRVLAPLPVLLPLLGAAFALLVSRRPRVQRVISVAVLTVVLAVAVALLVLADSGGSESGAAGGVTIGGWEPPIGITLVVDRLSALMLVVSATVTLGVLLYAIGQGNADGDEETPISIFHPTYLVLSAGVANAFLSGDLFNLYVGFEILLAASYVLLTLGGTAPRVQAGITYVVVSLLSSLVFLAGIGLVYAATGTLNMAQLSERLDDVPEGTRLVLQIVLLTAFGIKAAVFPLSAWLPDSYPTAPAPVTAVFAGLLTKVGVYAILRTQTLLFPDGRLNDLLMAVALATLVFGILGAIAQSDIKRLLSFTLVSHIGYMIFGIAVATTAGYAGAIFYVAHHILIQTTLFLAAGLIERKAGSTALDEIGGLARTAPVLGVLFFVPAMNLAGIPPLSGFLGKVGLIQAGVADGGAWAWVLVAGSLATSLLTLYAIARVWGKGFWRPREQAPAASALVRSGVTLAGAAGPSAGNDAARDPAEGSAALPKPMVAATAGLVLVTLAITVAAGPLYAIADRAAADLGDRSRYVQAVFPASPDGGAP